MKNKDCDHYYELALTKWEYPVGTSGTSAAIEYAYLMCKKCFKIVKKEVAYEITL